MVIDTSMPLSCVDHGPDFACFRSNIIVVFYRQCLTQISVLLSLFSQDTAEGDCCVMMLFDISCSLFLSVSLRPSSKLHIFGSSVQPKLVLPRGAKVDE